MAPQWYEMQGIEVRDTDRGGRVTYHGPGQLVAYPIVSLGPYGDDVHEYVRRLERVAIAALAELGVRTQTIEGLTGIWTEGTAPGDGGSRGEARKIGSIGVHVSRGVTTHGFAVNVNNDLQPFEWIVPCGIEGCQGHLARPRARRRAGSRRLHRGGGRPLLRGLRAQPGGDRPAGGARVSTALRLGRSS